MNQQELIAMLGRISKIMVENRNYLIELDSVVGDSDLGLTMTDGFQAAYEAVMDGSETDLGRLLYKAGKTMGNKVPSTMGTLMAAADACRKDLKRKDGIIRRRCCCFV
uniref:dihydroxyacetone kinase family protein n=1 Tax=Clostridium sp. NkU-1 TaxID=1095009 RepID=UPI000AAC5F90